METLLALIRANPDIRHDTESFMCLVEGNTPAKGVVAGLVASYFLQIGFDQMTINKSPVPKGPPEGFAAGAGFDEVYQIIADSELLGKMMVIICTNDHMVSFVKQPL